MTVTETKPARLSDRFGKKSNLRSYRAPLKATVTLSKYAPDVKRVPCPTNLLRYEWMLLVHQQT